MRGLIDSSCWPPDSTSPQRTGIINKAREMIYNSNQGGGWKGTTVTVEMSVHTDENDHNFITLPFGVETLIGCYNSCGRLGIRNPWFQYLRGSPPELCNGERQIDDLGDGFCTFVDIPSSGITPRFTIPVVQENDIVIVISGITTSGTQPREILTLAGGNYTVSSGNIYTSINLITFNQNQQNPVTMTDEGSGDVYGIYSPGEQTVNWRRYRLNQEDSTTVYAICKRKFILLIGDNDYVDISNLVAMEHAIRAYMAYNNYDYVSGDRRLGACIQLLNGELARFNGETEAGTIGLDPISGCGQIGNIL